MAHSSISEAAVAVGHRHLVGIDAEQRRQPARQPSQLIGNQRLGFVSSDLRFQLEMSSHPRNTGAGVSDAPAWLKWARGERTSARTRASRSASAGESER